MSRPSTFGLPFVAITFLAAACGGSTSELSSKQPEACGLSVELIGQAVEIPGGSFTRGTAPIYPEETSGALVEVQGFRMQLHEVTNSQFAEFVSETGYLTDAERSVIDKRIGAGSAVFSHPDERAENAPPWALVGTANWQQPAGEGSSIVGQACHPVIHVSKRDAAAYAKWVGGRLPSELEWEYAAAIGLPDPSDTESSAYSETGPQANTWQGLFPVTDLGTDGFEGIAPIASYAPNTLGLYDMIGNVWEWTDTVYGPGSHTIKGGSYLCAENFCRRYRPAARQPQETDFSSNHIGFRVVWDVE